MENLELELRFYLREIPYKMSPQITSKETHIKSNYDRASASLVTDIIDIRIITRAKILRLRILLLFIDIEQKVAISPRPDDLKNCYTEKDVWQYGVLRITPPPHPRPNSEDSDSTHSSRHSNIPRSFFSA